MSEQPIDWDSVTAKTARTIFAAAYWHLIDKDGRVPSQSLTIATAQLWLFKLAYRLGEDAFREWVTKQ